MTKLKIIIICICVCISCQEKKEGQHDPEKSFVNEWHIKTDHHVHLMSPHLISLWKEMGIPFTRTDHYYANIDTILKTNKATNISLVSMAYVYSSRDFGGNTIDVLKKTQEENDYLANAKSKYPDRIKAYYGVDPLSEFALAEIERCHKTLKLDGIKLHHNASQVYLTEPDHLKQVKSVFQYASDNRIPVLLHFDNSHPNFGKEDVRILADSVLKELDFLDLQIAHFGTSGGFSTKTKIILDRFIDLFEKNHPITKHKITFDISAVCLDKQAEGIAPLTQEEFSDLTHYCRKIGFNRIVFGTDYPLYRTDEYLSILRTKLNLSQIEVEQLLEKK